MSTTQPLVSPGRAALDGVIAMVAGLGIGNLVSLVAPGSSPVIPVAARFIDITPAPLKEWAIATFGTADKAVLIVGAIVVTLGLGALTGLVARRSMGAGLTCVAILAAIAITAAIPNASREMLWWAPGTAALTVGAWALPRLFRAHGRPSDETGENTGQSRRDWFRLAAALSGAGIVGAVIGRWPSASHLASPVALPARTLTPLPAGIESQAPGLSPFVTPSSSFFRIDTALGVPNIDVNEWRLDITGMVDRPYSITWPELLAMEAIERPVTLECVSNEVGGDLIGSAMWLGVRTSTLLAKAGVQRGADMVLASSIDNFSVSTPLPALLDDRDAMVVYGMNGAALPPEHGFPVRLLTPGLYGFVGATKWLVTLEVTTFAAKKAYWTTRGWSDHGPIKPSARIEVPRRGAKVTAGQVTVGGTAWAHGTGVGTVQVRVDQGPWRDATLGPEAGVQYWRQWIYRWDALPGDHELQVRVIDLQGKPQDETVAVPAPDGSSGLHTIRVAVS